MQLEKKKKKKKEKRGGNEKAFLGTVNTESFEVWDQLPWIQRTEEAIGKFLVT